MKKLTVDEMSETYAEESMLAHTELEMNLARSAFKDGWYAGLSSRHPLVRALYNESGLEMPEEKK